VKAVYKQLQPFIYVIPERLPQLINLYSFGWLDSVKSGCTNTSNYTCINQYMAGRKL